jgi:hypothetical protein
MTTNPDLLLFYSDERLIDAVIAVPADTSTLDALQRLVDGYVTCVSVGRGTRAIDVWVNDEGLHRDDFSMNWFASGVTRQSLIGPCVVTKSTPEGETIGLDDATIAECVRATGADPTPVDVDTVLARRAASIGASA